MDVLATKTARAARQAHAATIVLGGGVAANAALRDRVRDQAADLGIPRRDPAARPVHGQRGDDRRGRASSGREPVYGPAGTWRRARRCAWPGDRGPGRSRDPLDARHLGPAVLARYVREHGLSANRRLSQNFLADGEVLDAIVAEARVTPGRRILEIGPGPGILTGALLAAGADVTAVEIDRRMVAHLRERFGVPGRGCRRPSRGRPPAARRGRRPRRGPGRRSWPSRGTSSPTCRTTSPAPSCTTCSATEPRPERFVLMVQREVAERIAAPPGDLSYLSVFVQYHARRARRADRAADGVRARARGRIRRPGRRDAARVASTPDAEEDLWRLVQAGFRERRKMLHNVLPRQLPAVGRRRFVAALDRVGIAPERRPQTLSVEEWLALAAALGPLP